MANLVNAIQDSLTCLQLAVFSQSGSHLDKVTLCLSASSNSQFNSQSISPARWSFIIHPPFFSHSAHFVPSKTFSRNQTPLKTHSVQLKTFIRNKIVSGRRARLRLSAFLPGTWLMLHHRTRRIQAAGHRHRVLREGHEKGYRLRSYQIQGHPGRAAGGLPESLRPV